MNVVDLKSISKSIKKLMEEMGSIVYWTQDGYISFDQGSWLIRISDENPNEINLSVHIDVCPAMAVNTSIAVCDFANRNGMKVIACDCFAHEFDEHDRITGLVFGQDAYQKFGSHSCGGCFDE